MRHRLDEILRAPPPSDPAGEEIGRSREGRDICAFRFGSGNQRVSLLAGCHADEPVGPRFLLHLCGYLNTLPEADSLLEDYEWWIVPHINPDGAERNRAWQGPGAERYDLVEYLRHRVRELPGDDIEFGFPRDRGDSDARSENRSVFEWWSRAAGPYALHVSLHGMGFAAGPWFLVEEAWKDRCDRLVQRCTARTEELGYSLHDVERLGEKGFFRLGKGFCTRPDSRYMRKHFLDRGDENTASKFRPSSMETIRSFGGDALTLVSEMPLFLIPGVGEQLGPPDPVAQEWKDRIAVWTAQLQNDARSADDAATAAAELGLRAMPVRDQMELQWTFIVAGLEQVTSRAQRRA